MDNSHIEILGDKAIIYDSEESLIDIFKNIRTIIASRDDWNAYTEYTPEKVMKKFMDVFISDKFNLRQIQYINMNKESPIFKDNIEIEDNTYLPPLYDNYLQNFYKCKTKNYCFIHSCCLEKDKTYRLDYLINDLVKSNCINSLDKIYINNIGEPLDNFYIESFKDMNDMNKAKFETNNYSLNINLQEAATINKMISFSKQNPNNNILYIHTKGIRFDINDSKQTDWINMMTHFLLYNSNKCIEKLNDCYDSVGCNYHDGTGEHKKHYSGNFWWSKTNHLAKLEYINELDNPRSVVEFHLFSIDHKCFEIHKSNINHYFENYPKEKYKDINV